MQRSTANRASHDKLDLAADAGNIYGKPRQSVTAVDVSPASRASETRTRPFSVE